MEDLRIILRPFNPSEDQALVYSTWQLGLWGSTHRSSDRPTPSFFVIQTRMISKVLANPDTKVRIACSSDNQMFIIGYSVMNQKHLIWVYVKDDYRKHGIGTLLTEGFETVGPLQTKSARDIGEVKPLKVVE